MVITVFGFELGLLQPYLPFAVGCGVASAVLVAVATRRRKSPLAGPPSVTPTDRPVNWDAHDTSFADRRGSVRREGAPVRVLVSSPVLRNKLEGGWVLDRSTGGLRLATVSPIAPGTVVQVRAENAPDTIPWVTIVVRSCRNNGDYYELGCEFEQTPPWNVLLLFG